MTNFEAYKDNNIAILKYLNRRSIVTTQPARSVTPHTDATALVKSWDCCTRNTLAARNPKKTLDYLSKARLSPTEATALLISYMGEKLANGAPKETLAYMAQVGLDKDQAAAILQHLGYFLADGAAKETLAYLTGAGFSSIQATKILVGEEKGERNNEISSRLAANAPKETLAYMAQVGLDKDQAINILDSITGHYLVNGAAEETLAYLIDMRLDPIRATKILKGIVGFQFAWDNPEKTLAYIKSLPLNGTQLREIEEKLKWLDNGRELLEDLNAHATFVEIHGSRSAVRPAAPTTGITSLAATLPPTP